MDFVIKLNRRGPSRAYFRDRRNDFRYRMGTHNGCMKQTGAPDNGCTAP